MVVAVTRITAPKAALEHMAEAFRRAAPDLKQLPGFQGFELWLSDTTLQAVSRWDSHEAIEAYAKSGLFATHHPGGAQGQNPAGGQVERYEAEVVL